MHPTDEKGTHVTRPARPLSLAALTTVFVLTAAAPALARPPVLGPNSPSCGARDHTSIGLQAHIEAEGHETHWSFESSATQGGPWAPVPGGSGLITQAEADATQFGVTREAELTGLTPEVADYVLITATSAEGTSSEEIRCEAEPLRAQVFLPPPRNITATSAYFSGEVFPRGFRTHWRIQYATSEEGPWTTAPGAEGTIDQAEAEVAPKGGPYPHVGARLSGLQSATPYYVRILAESEPEFEGHKESKQATSGLQSFTTSGGPPTATAFAIHSFDGESLRLLGYVNSEHDGAPTSEEQTTTIEGAPTGGTFTLAFKGQATEPIAFDAPAAGVGSALGKLSTLGNGVEVAGPAGGPYTIYFGGKELAGKDQPPLTADASGLTPPGVVTVATTQQGGEGYDTHDHFEYIAEEKFTEDGQSFGAGTESTPEVEGSGVIGADLPSLKAGESYRYRLFATSTVPGNPVVRSAEQTLVVPTPALAGPEAPCPNQAFRTGLSANLPDCRAYEQLTPVEKGGTMDISTYGLITNRHYVGEDGEHLMLTAPGTNWGTGPDSKATSYFFSRTPAGWGMTSATPQPEAGANSYLPQVLSPDLNQIAVLVKSEPTSFTGSLDEEFEVGPPGGPYTTALTQPRNSSESVWIGGSADGSKLLLATKDHSLLGHPTGTASGEYEDLYEFSTGALHQANVTGSAPGSTIGACGAHPVVGLEGYQETGLAASFDYTSAHAVSADGSHVFFYAGFGGECPEPYDLRRGYGPHIHLYVRIDGSETLDLGAYHFLGANAQGTKVLLEKPTGGQKGFEVFLCDTETGIAKHILSAPVGGGAAANDGAAIVSEDFNAFYLFSTAALTPEALPASFGVNLYRYDILTETLRFVDQVEFSDGHTNTGGISTSPDGRYFYFGGRQVGGVSVGNNQVYRYDNTEDVIQCMSCASPFDPEPKLVSSFLASHESTQGDELPNEMVSSANGDYVFFETPAALLPSDIDGEIAPSEEGFGEVANARSLSSDTYEWRRNGVDGCVHVQGCLALISGGTGGYKNELLGTDPSGRDVFFSTHEALLPSDKDKAGDIYDARIGGGFAPPPPPPVECEGDACSTPLAAPIDTTPASLTFSGAGNVVEPSLAKSQPRKPTKHKAKARKKTKKRSRRAEKHSGRSKR
ncbi:MAG TPA: hypothetical protein VNY52_06815 [Solirubrobacteraceae bacterium]|jgi:hypothetical protein|nr:hypothetical protein [Solirubrobacteraceae bacterium]